MDERDGWVIVEGDSTNAHVLNLSNMEVLLLQNEINNPVPASVERIFPPETLGEGALYLTFQYAGTAYREGPFAATPEEFLRFNGLRLALSLGEGKIHIGDEVTGYTESFEITTTHHTPTAPLDPEYFSWESQITLRFDKNPARCTVYVDEKLVIDRKSFVPSSEVNLRFSKGEALDVGLFIFSNFSTTPSFYGAAGWPDATIPFEETFESYSPYSNALGSRVPWYVVPYLNSLGLDILSWPQENNFALQIDRRSFLWGPTIVHKTAEVIRRFEPLAQNPYLFSFKFNSAASRPRFQEQWADNTGDIPTGGNWDAYVFTEFNGIRLSLMDRFAGWDSQKQQWIEAPILFTYPEGYASTSLDILFDTASGLYSVYIAGVPVLQNLHFTQTPSGNPVLMKFIPPVDLSYFIDDISVTFFGGESASDTDNDGIPDDWERLLGADPNDPNDADTDPHGTGYTYRVRYDALTQGLPDPAMPSPTTPANPTLPRPDWLPENYPAWWYNENHALSVIFPQSDTSVEANYAPVNLGQLKWITTQAKAYLDTQWASSGGTGIDLETMFPPMPAPGEPETPERAVYDAAVAANYAPANLGQLKAVAKPFYDKLAEKEFDVKAYLLNHGYPGEWAYPYPWNPTTPVEANYASANLGQLKLVFGFEIAGSGGSPYPPGVPFDPLLDSDGDGIPDYWEYILGSNPFVADANTDPNGTGYSFLERYNALRNGLPDPAANPMTLADLQILTPSL